MHKQSILTGGFVTLALLSACATPTPPPLSLAERLPIAVDFLRQPNGASRPRAEAAMAEASCEEPAARAKQRVYLASLALPPIALLSVDVPANMQRAFDNAYLQCEKSYGWARVATEAEANQIAAQARADRLASR
jgi:hypothetical protein